MTGYRPGGDARKDVTRLALMCGPATGMRALGAVVEDTASAGGEPRRHAIELLEDQCVRAFVVGAEGTRLEARIVGPGGEILASDRSGATWLALPASGVACARSTGVYAVEIRATETTMGARHALWTWLLP